MSFDFGSLGKGTDAVPKNDDEPREDIMLKVEKLVNAKLKSVDIAINKLQKSIRVPDNAKINRMIAEHMEMYQKEFNKRIQQEVDVLELWDGIFQTIVKMWGIRGGIGKRAAKLDHVLRQNFG